MDFACVCLLHLLPAASCLVVQVTVRSDISCGGLIERRGHVHLVSAPSAPRRHANSVTNQEISPLTAQRPSCLRATDTRTASLLCQSTWEKVTTVLARTVRRPTPQPGSLQGLCRCSTRGLAPRQAAGACEAFPIGSQLQRRAPRELLESPGHED